MNQMQATVFHEELANGDPVAIVTDNDSIQLGTGYENITHVLRSVSEACKGNTSSISFTPEEMKILTKTNKVQVYHGPSAVLERKYRKVK